MNITIRTSGFLEFKQRLQGMKENVDSILETAVESGIMSIQELAQDNVPVKTGNLKRNILRRVERTGSGKVKGTCYVDLSGAPYGAEVEFGSIGLPAGVILPVNKKVLRWEDETGEEHFSYAVFQPGKPYMRPAFDQGGREAIEKCRQMFLEGIKG